MTAHKLAAEEAIRACGVPYTIFCPTWPMEMLPRYARSRQPLMIGDQPLPALRLRRSSSRPTQK